MLTTDEYGQIKTDYDRISREYFPAHYFHPDQMRFANSEAVFPTEELTRTLGIQYRQQCELLCYGPFQEWDGVLERFEGLKEALQR